MKNKNILASIVCALGLAASPVLADTLTVFSSPSTTISGALNPVGGIAGPESSTQITQLDTGDTSGVTSWVPAQGNVSGTFTAPPAAAPSGAATVNFNPIGVTGDGTSPYGGIDGYSGFFYDTFTLPAVFSGASLSGAGNVDDQGTVFLNGHLISGVKALAEFGDATFGTSTNSYFQPGINTLMIADDNSGGGPSGAAYYANVNFNGTAVPLPGAAPGMLALFGLLGLVGLAKLRREQRA